MARGKGALGIMNLNGSVQNCRKETAPGLTKRLDFEKPAPLRK
ncbi:hypothetical protein T4C_1720 [Trichinella pseudospiralis]|uniref:Uncharacterized protein n=1 Tax=Trichinella pseudospiralis TaxID=6337 RepID=A0A0V1G7F0_TRIPS|nr:hypothetical protein T4C_1720 [Trichinella pseudospiralis]